jgi:hypothetical protein
LALKSRKFVSLVAAVAALLAVAPGAGAMTGSAATTGEAASYIKVTTTPTLYFLCMPTPDTIRAQWKFKAKIKRSGTSLPKKVRVSYKVTDLTTGTLVGEEVLYLKPRSFSKFGKEMDYVTGHQMQYDFKSQYRAPNTGRMVTAKSTQTDTIPTAQEFVDAGAPACVAG